MSQLQGTQGNGFRTQHSGLSRSRSNSLIEIIPETPVKKTSKRESVARDVRSYASQHGVEIHPSTLDQSRQAALRVSKAAATALYTKNDTQAAAAEARQERETVGTIKKEAQIKLNEDCQEGAVTGAFVSGGVAFCCTIALLANPPGAIVLIAGVTLGAVSVVGAPIIGGIYGLYRGHKRANKIIHQAEKQGIKMTSRQKSQLRSQLRWEGASKGFSKGFKYNLFGGGYRVLKSYVNAMGTR
jgi:hypothetical protein